MKNLGLVTFRNFMTIIGEIDFYVIDGVKRKPESIGDEEKYKIKESDIVFMKQPMRVSEKLNQSEEIVYFLIPFNPLSKKTESVPFRFSDLLQPFPLSVTEHVQNIYLKNTSAISLATPEEKKIVLSA